jgi:hypothetical protein
MERAYTQALQLFNVTLKYNNMTDCGFRLQRIVMFQRDSLYFGFVSKIVFGGFHGLKKINIYFIHLTFQQGTVGVYLRLKLKFTIMGFNLYLYTT